MKLGFTGTRHGMTAAQLDAFHALIVELCPREFHHGDCVGADDQAATMVAEAMGAACHIFSHPPVDETHRAFSKAHTAAFMPQTHFARNRNIVDSADALVACPREAERQPRGGTWYTYDYALKRRKPTIVIFPDGTVSREGAADE